MPTVTTEDYLKRLYRLEQECDGKVPMGQLAKAMQVVPGTATAMGKKLAKDRLVDYQPYEGVRLTPSGRQVALDVLRRHRLVEAFLVEVLDLDWATVHEDAEQLEHVISEGLLDRIDAYLGHPDVDPHGDPIPDAQGRVKDSAGQRLSECDPGATVRIERLLDQSRDFLQFAEAHGLRPGHEVTIEERDEPGDAMRIRASSHEPVTLGMAAAGRFLVAYPPTG